MSVSLKALRLAGSGLLASALRNVFPGCVIIGNSYNRFGFYCDAIMGQAVDAACVPLIEEEMRRLSKSAAHLRIQEMMRENAIGMLRYHGLQELAENLESQSSLIVPLLQVGDYFACIPDSLHDERFPESMAELKSLKLLSIEQVKGDGRIFRVLGAVAENDKSLKKIIKTFSHRSQYDHMFLGKEMRLFSLQEESIYWLPRGTRILHQLLRLQARSSYMSGYEKVLSPLFIPAKNELKIRGVLSKQYQFFLKDALQCQDALPYRVTEAGVFSTDIEQEEYNLFDLQFPSCDTSHIFLLEEDLQAEVISCLQFIVKFIKMFAFRSRWRLALPGAKKPDKILLPALKKAFEEASIEIAEEKTEAKTKQPKAQLLIEDAYGSEWPVSEISLGKVPNEQRVFCCSWSLFGSLERFIALLLETYAGQIPFGIAPEQARVIAVGTQAVSYAKELRKNIADAGFNAGMDISHLPLNAKIHAAEKEKVPYLAVVGVKEEMRKTVALRRHGHNLENDVGLKSFLSELEKEAKIEPIT